MNSYESIIIINSNLEEAVIKSTIEKVTDLIAKHGKVESTEEWGKKKLAYPIKKELNGYYFLMQFEANKDIEAEINRKARLDENVLRHLIIKLDEE